MADARENAFPVNGDYPFLPKIFCRFFLSDKKQYAGFFGTTGSVRVSIGLENPKKEMTGWVTTKKLFSGVKKYICQKT